MEAAAPAASVGRVNTFAAAFEAKSATEPEAHEQCPAARRAKGAGIAAFHENLGAQIGAALLGGGKLPASVLGASSNRRTGSDADLPQGEGAHPSTGAFLHGPCADCS